MIITRTPFRITLGGGGTDLPSYYTKNGGMVLTMAIDKYVYITLKPDYFESLCKLRYSEIEITNDISKLKNTRARQALLNHNLTDVEINTCADLSSKSGLGSSGSFLVGLLKAIKEFTQSDSSPKSIAEEACDIEINQLQEPVGKQDQYIAAFGGIKILNINQEGKVEVSKFSFDYNRLINNMRVYSINVYRNASDILKDQNKSDSKTSNILDHIKEYGYKTIELLKNNSFDEYGFLLDSYWSLKKQLSSKITLSNIDELYEIVKTDYNVLGGKIIGAGGGGFLLLYCNKNHEHLDNYMSSLGMKKLNYNVDFNGSTILGNHLK